MIDSMFQAGTDMALDDQLQRPRAPTPPSGPGWFAGLGDAVGRNVGAAGLRAGAFGAEMTGAFGDVMGSYPEAMGIPLTDVQKKQGAAFTLQQFHDDFMRHGFAPIKVIRKTMLHDDSPVL